MNPLSRLWRHRALVAALTRRELAARYRGGVLGYFWSLINPLLLLAVYATIFRLVFTPRADVHPYALFLFIGVLAWAFVSSALIDSAEAFRANGPLLRKTTVAPEIFPAAAVSARLFHWLRLRGLADLRGLLRIRRLIGWKRATTTTKLLTESRGINPGIIPTCLVPAVPTWN